MKSLLQEASSVEKAVALAWEAAGCPKEFTVKVLEKGERGFLGFSKKPAVVSIVYKPLVKPSSTSTSTTRRPLSPRSTSPKRETTRRETGTSASRTRTTTRRSTPSTSTARSAAPAPERTEEPAPRVERPVREERPPREESAPREERPAREERAPREDSSSGLLGGTGRSESSDRRDRGPRQRRDRNDRSDRRDRGDRDDKPRGLLMYVEGEEGDKPYENTIVPEDVNLAANAVPASAVPASAAPTDVSSADISSADARSHEPATEKFAQSDSFDKASDSELAEVNWTEEFVDEIASTLKEILVQYDTAATFTTTVDEAVLRLDLSTPIVEDEEARRMFYASLSFLLLQVLKRKHKKRFRGYRLSIKAA